MASVKFALSGLRSPLCLKENSKKLRKEILVSHYFFLSEVTLSLIDHTLKLPGIDKKRKEIVMQKFTHQTNFHGLT